MGNCGSALMTPCLSATDVRYDANFPKNIAETDPRWEKLEGFFKANIRSFDSENGGMKQPGGYSQFSPSTYHKPYLQESSVAFFNHTFDGSRLIVSRYYFNGPAPQSFCESDLPGFESNASPGNECGVNGLSKFGGLYAALNHENDGSLSMAKVVGSDYSGLPSKGSDVKIASDDTIEFSYLVDGLLSSVSSFVFFNDDTASFSTVRTDIRGTAISSTNTGRLTRLTEDQFKAGIAEYNGKFNVPENAQVAVPAHANLTEMPSDGDWCGGLVNDVSCTPTPYEEPPTQMKGGFIAMFVIIGIAVLGAAGYWYHKDAQEKQKRRYKEQFVRGIASHITITDSAGKLSPEALKKEFDLIDKDGGGTIDKAELKEFVATGKLGKISNKDFEALWLAIDIDNSGEVDFTEFVSFLSQCNTEFSAVNKEQRATPQKSMPKVEEKAVTKNVEVAPKVDEIEEKVAAPPEEANKQSSSLPSNEFLSVLAADDGEMKTDTGDDEEKGIA